MFLKVLLSNAPKNSLKIIHKFLRAPTERVEVLAQKMASSLDAIATGDGADGSKSKSDQYVQFLNEATASGNIEAFKQFVDHGAFAASFF